MKDIIIAINNLCTGAETKLLLSMLLCEPDEITMQRMLEMTGITKPNNYFRTRKGLMNLGYIVITADGPLVNTDKILSDYALLTK